MKVLIKKAKILSPSSPFHGTLQDVLIENGIIINIKKDIKDDAEKIIDVANLHISCGWMDCFANFCDPGNEYKETLETGANAAAAGGFTQVMLVPDTQPTVSSKSQIEYLTQKSKGLPVDILPIASITKNLEGKELSEMYDMYHSGAVAFSDGTQPVQSAGILQKALEYVIAINATIIQLPDDKSIGAAGLISEGEVSAKMGLPGKPALSEELMIARDIEVAKYTNSKIHFTGVSTAKSLKLIAEAKDQNLFVTCSVTPYHLFFCENDLMDYDTNLKVNPPLRTKEDREALLQGIKNGNIDFIASHHRPENRDSKICEFEYAGFGMETLESVYGAASVCGIPTDNFIKMQTENIRSIFNVSMPMVDITKKAVITLFIPGEEYIFEEKDILSKSKNNAFIGKKLKGKIIGTINGDKIFLNKN